MKVVPWPWTLETAMSPPSNRLNARVMARPEAGAAELAGGRFVRLREALEEAAELIGGHADAGVADPELDLRLRAFAGTARRPA